MPKKQLTAGKRKVGGRGKKVHRHSRQAGDGNSQCGSQTILQEKEYERGSAKPVNKRSDVITIGDRLV